MVVVTEAGSRLTRCFRNCQSRGRPILFEPFRSGIDERQPRGLGLGLFIAHRIVLAHGGTIEVASTSSEGTRFTVCLPRAGAAKQRQLP